MGKLQTVWENGKLVLKGDSSGDDDCYIAVRPNNSFIIVPTQAAAEEFGGKIYFVTHYNHTTGDGEVERLPQSHFLKEV